MRLALLTFASGCLIGPQPGFGGSGEASGSGTNTNADTGTDTDGQTTSMTDDGTLSGTGSDDSTGDDPQPVPLGPAGYEPRACGFDLDRDGVPGDPHDCVVCDGSTDAPFTEGHPQRMVYVDCDAGTDVMDCGDPQNPCGSLGYPLEGIWNTQEELGEQMIVCFRGTCPGTATELPNGFRETYSRTASGSEARDFEYPRIPTVLAGWDSNGNREYPPFDPEDTAVIDMSATNGAFHVLSQASFSGIGHDMELAHFEVIGGTGSGTEFISVNASDGPVERIHYHDIEVHGFHEGEGANTDTSIIELGARSYMGQAGQVRWFALENVEFDNYGSYVVAEFADLAQQESGPIRVQNVTATTSTCDVSDCTEGAASRFWHSTGFFSQVEIIDSVFDTNTATWAPFLGADPDGANPPSVAITVGECNQEFTIRNNRFLDHHTAVRVEGNSVFDACDGDRPVSGVSIEGNLFVGPSYELSANTTLPFYVTDGRYDDEGIGVIGEVRIVNNAAMAEHGWLACAATRASGAGAGPVSFDHNTCIARLREPMGGSGHLWVRTPEGGAAQLGELAARNNLFAGSEPADIAVLVGAAPGVFTSDNNVFDPAAMFAWQGSVVDLAGWQSAAGSDAASLGCTPEFLPDGDFHLAATDVCAADGGATLPGIIHDIDGDPRPMGPTPDVGADEF